MSECYFGSVPRGWGTRGGPALDQVGKSTGPYKNNNKI